MGVAGVGLGDGPPSSPFLPHAPAAIISTHTRASSGRERWTVEVRTGGMPRSRAARLMLTRKSMVRFVRVQEPLAGSRAIWALTDCEVASTRRIGHTT